MTSIEEEKIQDLGHGLLLNPPVTDPEADDRHYVFGSFSAYSGNPIIMKGGHGWESQRPPGEIQNKNGLETMNCTNYGTQNAWETLAFFKGFNDFPRDCSERYSGILTGTTPSGNDPHHVAEVIRTTAGVLPESFLPFSDDINTWDEYYSPKPMLSAYSEIAKVMLKKFKFGHDWVIFPGSFLTPKQKGDRIKEALQYGPVCVSVFAWKSGDDDLYYKEPGDRDNHWVQLLDFVEGKYWLIYDHYGLFGDNTKLEKKLRWDFDFNASKVYYLDRLAAKPQPTFGWYLWAVLIDRVNRGFEKFIGAFK